LAALGQIGRFLTKSVEQARFSHQISSKFPGELVESKHIEIFIPEHLEKFQLFILFSIVYYAEPTLFVHTKPTRL
jgi:hypothetical protein